MLRTDLTDALSRADRGLYLAKEQGRNRVVVDTGEA
jgi:PleD family two-component response regulator